MSQINWSSLPANGENLFVIGVDTLYFDVDTISASDLDIEGNADGSVAIAVGGKTVTFTATGGLNPVDLVMNTNFANGSQFFSLSDQTVENKVGSGAGDVFLNVGEGDVVDGGAGTDAVVFFANRSDYQIVKVSAAEVRVTKSGDVGFSTLKNVEALAFDNALVLVADLPGQYVWSQLKNGDVLPFDPETDTLRFDNSAITAKGLSWSTAWDQLTGQTTTSFTYSGTKITIEADIKSLTPDNLAFEDGGKFLVGDGTTDPFADDLANTIEGGSGSDYLMGFGGNDLMKGGAGDDGFYLGYSKSLFGRDTVQGGGGNDNISMNSNATGAGYVNLEKGLLETPLGKAYLSSIEIVSGTAGDDTIIGGDATHATDDRGNQIAETLTGKAGNDLLIGGAGVDFFTFADYSGNSSNQPVSVNLGLGTANDGMGGTDTLVNIDAVNGGSGNDYLMGGSQNRSNNGILFERFRGNAGNDTLDGAMNNQGLSEVNRADYANNSSSQSIQVNLSASDITLSSGTVVKAGTARDGRGGVDTLIDITQVHGGAGNDLLVGGEGWQGFDGGKGNDTLKGGDGQDQARFVQSTAGVIVNLSAAPITVSGKTVAAGTAADGMGGTDTLVSMENVMGSPYDDYIRGSDDPSYYQEFAGGAGKDTIIGGGGIDFVSYQGVPTKFGGMNVFLEGATSDVVDEYGDVDHLEGIEGVRGTRSNDTLTGGSGDQYFKGDMGDDIIDGGDGTDTVMFSGSIDEYAITSSQENGIWTFAVQDLLDGRNGTDRVTNVEKFDFAGVIFAPNNGSLKLDGATPVNPKGTWLAATGDGETPTKVFVTPGDVLALTRGGAYSTADGAPDTSSSMVAVFLDVDGNPVAPAVFRSNTTTSVAGRDIAEDFDAATGVTRVVVPANAVTLALSVVDASYSNNTDPNGDLLVLVEKYDNTTPTSGADLLFGGVGSDKLSGGEGADTLIGGAGNDTLDGGAQISRVRSADANTVSYQTSDSSVQVNLQTGIASDGFGGTDQLSNLSFVVGSKQADTLTGSTALIFESFEGRLGDDTIDGGAIDGNYATSSTNRASYQNAAAAVVVDLTAGTATGGDGSDTLVNINSVRASNFDDTLSGSNASAYTESFEGRAGNDVIDGKGGTDLIRFDYSPAAVTVNLATGQAQDGYGTIDTFINIEGIWGSAFNDVLTGGLAANGAGVNDGFEFFQGNEGDDTIDGGAGWDRVDYTNSITGVTVRLGGTQDGSAQDGFGGTDTLKNIEAVRGSTFNDLLVASSRNTFLVDGYLESLEGLEGDDTLDGGAANMVRADYKSSGQSVLVDLKSGRASDGFGGIDTLIGINAARGSAYSDTITGNDKANMLDGQGGNDLMIGGPGNDTLRGMEGNDTYRYVIGVDGKDVIQDSGKDNVPVNYGNDTLILQMGVDGVDGAIFVSPTSASDLMLQTFAVDGAVNSQITIKNQFAVNGTTVTGLGYGAIEKVTFLNAEGSSQSFTVAAGQTGGDGDDLIAGTVGGDTQTGGQGSDFMMGAWGDDNLSGDAGDDYLNGGAGSDTLDGGAGDDELEGGAGSDAIVGGEGQDVALYIDSSSNYEIHSAEFDVDGVATRGFTVTDIRDGSVDTLMGVEALNFSDEFMSLEVSFQLRWDQNGIRGTQFDDVIDAESLAANYPSNFTSDNIDGGAGDDLILAGAGDDWIRKSEGNDTVDGGDGFDTLNFLDASTNYILSADDDGSIVIERKADGQITTVKNIEGLWFEGDHYWTTVGLRIDLSSSSDSWAQNWINGSLVGEIIDADKLADDAALTDWATPEKVPNTYRDWINAGEGNDLILAGKGGDNIQPGGGNDTVDGGPNVDLQTLLQSQNTWALEDRVQYSGISTRYSITALTDDAEGTVTGTANQDYFEVKDLRSGSPDGTDIVFNVDALNFTDKEVRLTPSYSVNRQWVFDSEIGLGTEAVKGINVSGTVSAEIIGAVGDLTDLFAGSDRLEGKAGDDSLYGGAGGDTLRGDKGNDFLDGGANRAPTSETNVWDPNGDWAGGDVAEYSGSKDRYVVSKLTDDQAGTATGYAGATYFEVKDTKATGDGTDTVVNVETLRFNDGEMLLNVRVNQWSDGNGGVSANVDGTDFDDVIDVTSSEMGSLDGKQIWVRAGAGDDRITGSSTADDIEGGEGDDTIDGGANLARANDPWNTSDRVHYDANMSRFVITRDEDTGVVTVKDKLSAEFGGLGTDTLKNIEELNFNEGDWMRLTVRFDGPGNANDQWARNNIEGTDFNDLVKADQMADERQVTLKRDNIRTGSGNDTVFAGAGGDYIEDAAGNDFYDGGANGTVVGNNAWDAEDVVRFSGKASRYQIDVLSYAELAQGSNLKLTLDANYSAEQRPSVIVRVKDLLPDAVGGDGINYLVNVERIEFSEGQPVRLGVQNNYVWQPYQAPTSDLETFTPQQMGGRNGISGGLLPDMIDARDHDVNVITSVAGTQIDPFVWVSNTGWFTNRDYIEGGAGNDTIYAGAGGDQIKGGAGDDLIYGGANGVDNIDYDRATFSNKAARYDVKFFAPVAAGTGGFNDRGLATTGGNFARSSFYDPNGFIVVTDTFSAERGGEGRDVLYGIELLEFSDTGFELLARQDVQEYDESYWGVIADDGAGNQTWGQITTKVKYADMHGSPVGDRIVGVQDAKNSLFGNAGDDSLKGGDLADELNGGLGNDTLDGGGNRAVDPTRPWDTWSVYDKARFDAEAGQFDVTKAKDLDGSVTGTAGQDYYRVEHLIPAALGGLGVDVVFNVEILVFSDVKMPLQVKVDADNLNWGATPIQYPKYSGTVFDDAITGTGGADFMDGGFGDDALSGGAGDDVFVTRLGDDIVQGGDGIDRVVYPDAPGRYIITKGPTAGSWTVTDKLADAYGGEGTDTLTDVEFLLFDKPTIYGIGETSNAGDASQPSGTYWAWSAASATVVVVDPTGIERTGGEANDWLGGSVGNDTLLGGAGDDTLVADKGNDTLDGGTDNSASQNNYWNAGDVAEYAAAPSSRFDIQIDPDTDVVTLVDLASLKVLNVDSWGADGHLTADAMVDANLEPAVGLGRDTLVNVEKIRFSDVTLDLVPQHNSWTWTSQYNDADGQAVTYEVTRHNFTGTFKDDLLIGTNVGDNFDGKGGNDTIDGGVETTTAGNVWDIQDVVNYSGTRARYEIEGVRVRVTETNGVKHYEVISTDVQDTDLPGLRVTDLLPASAGGSGSDLIVNVERINFAFDGSNESSISIVPEVWTSNDWNAPLTWDEGGMPVTFGQSINIQGTIFDDLLYGGEYGDNLQGKAGNDTLVGGAGGDRLEGGAGNDVLLGGANGADRGGWAPTDTALFNGNYADFVISSVTYEGQAAIQVTDLAGDLGTDILVGVEGISFNDQWLSVSINRWSWEDTYAGILNGGADGTAFDDVVVGDKNQNGTDANQAVFDNLRGHGGDDVLLGLEGGDRLEGGGGNDVLDGGANGTTGDSWRDQDTAQFSGPMGRYTITPVSVVAAGDGYVVKVNGEQVASLVGEAFTISTSAADVYGEGVAAVIQNAQSAGVLTAGLSGLLVVDSLPSSLDGDGADLVFNVENLNFKDGSFEQDASSWANDWNGDGAVDNVWTTGTARADVIDPAKLAELTGRSLEDLAGASFNTELRAGDDTYIGGDGSDWVRPGAGNDYIDGGDNSGMDQWGNSARDEVAFGGSFKRYVLVDVHLTKTDDVWTMTSTRNADLSFADGVLSVANAETSSLSDEMLAGMQQGVLAMIAHAEGNAVDGWLVADKLPAEFDGNGVDALVNVEFLSFNDKWMPLQAQLNLWYEWVFDADTGQWMRGDKINGSQSEGTDQADTMGVGSTSLYDFSGNDNFNGGAGNDTIHAGAGGDWLRGGAGDDLLDGGANSVDQWGNVQGDNVHYDGEYARYVITGNADGSVTVTDSEEDGDGVDTLVDIESIGFADRWIRLGVDTWTWNDPDGRLQGVNLNGSFLSDTIDLSESGYTGVNVNIQGNEGDDTIVGSDGPDWINGGQGSDQIDGGANGVDFWGNSGSDTVQFEGLYSRYTVERIRPDTFDADGNTFNGQRFTIAGKTYEVVGADTTTGVLAHIALDGQAVNVNLVRVTDSLAEEDGGNGTDLLVNVESIAFWDRWVTLEMAQAFTDLDGDGRPDSVEVFGTDDADEIALGDISGKIIGGEGNDTLYGGAGDDILDGGADDDELHGGDGHDVAVYAGNQSDYTITVNETSGTVTVSSSDEGEDTLGDIEGLQFQDGYVSLAITEERVDVDGDGKADIMRLIGRDGGIADSIDGADFSLLMKAFEIVGGSGNDTLIGGSGKDKLTGGAGDDELVGGEGKDVAFYSGERAGYQITRNSDGSVTVDDTNLADGDDGTDTVTGIEELRFTDKTVSISLTAPVATYVDIDTNGDKKVDQRVWQGTDEDTDQGFSGADIMVGAASLSNVVNAGSGDDVITGGNLGDTFRLGAGNDTVDGGANQGLKADGTGAADVVLFEGVYADYVLSNLQVATVQVSGSAVVGDVLTLTLGQTPFTVPVTANTADKTASGLAAALAQSVTDMTGVSANAVGDKIFITAEARLFGVTGEVTNASGSSVALGATSYERYTKVVEKATGETDILKNIESASFADRSEGLNPTVISKATWTDEGLEKVDYWLGTDRVDVLLGGARDDVFTGGGRGDRFVIADGSGQDQITDFNAEAGDAIVVLLGANDTDGLNGTGVTSAQELVNRATEEGANVRIDLGAGNSLVLVGVALDAVNTSMFEVLTGF
jgi:Ca2+-binding RTX toxin-like protein